MRKNLQKKKKKKGGAYKNQIHSCSVLYRFIWAMQPKICL